MRAKELIFRNLEMWAKRHWPEQTDKPLVQRGAGYYTRKLNDNLFQPLSAATRAAYEKADGQELATKGEKLPKMHALHSSAAMVCNVFDYWRGAGIQTIAEAVGGSGCYTEMEFEATHEVVPGRKKANLDVQFVGPSASVMSIEAKFCEPYSPAKNTFASSYFTTEGLWNDLPNVRRLTEQIHEGKQSFVTLCASQLIKHIIGLTKDYGPGNYELVYLWFDIGEVGGEAEAERDRHADEIKKFWKAVQTDARFRAMTYQEVFQKISQNGQAGPKYIEYLAEKYFDSRSD